MDRQLWKGSEETWKGLLKHIIPLSGYETAKLIEIRPGHCRFSIEVTETMINLYGNMHGGFIFTLCDMAAGMATYAYDISNVTLQGNINFVRSIKENTTVYVCSDTVHKGRHTAVNHVEVRDGRDMLLASAQMSMFITGDVN